MSTIVFIIKMLFLWLFNFIYNFEAGINSNIIKFILTYWIVFLFLEIILIIYDLLIFFIRHSILDRIYFSIMEYGNLRFMTYIAEAYYIFDKLFYKLSLGIVKASVEKQNEFRKYRSFGFIYIIEFIKSLILQMFKISKYNILIWFIILLYYQPGFIKNLYNSNISTYLGMAEKALSNIKSGEIKKIFDDMRIIWGILVVVINGFLIYQKSNFLNDEEKEKTAFQAQENIEKFLSSIVIKAEENINLFSNQIEFYPTYFCSLVTDSDRYVILGNKLENLGYSRSKHISVEELVERYESYSEETDAINEILKTINSQNISAFVSRLNNSSRYEYIHLSLYNQSLLKYTILDLLGKEKIKNFIESWTDKEYLKEKFNMIQDVDFGYKSKNQAEKEYNEHSKISFEKIVKSAEEDLEIKAIAFGKMAKTLLAEAIYTHILAERYLNKIHKRRKRKILNKLFKIFPKK